jgi:hypothetical protein
MSRRRTEIDTDFYVCYVGINLRLFFISGLSDSLKVKPRMSQEFRL